MKPSVVPQRPPRLIGEGEGEHSPKTPTVPLLFVRKSICPRNSELAGVQSSFVLVVHRSDWVGESNYRKKKTKIPSVETHRE